MADCHNLFSEFNQRIRLTDERRHALIMARNDLRQRIVSGFARVAGQQQAVQRLDFQTQGSFIMDTIINPISEDYDLDYGVYFIGSSPRVRRPAPKDFHDFVVSCIQPGNPHVERIEDKDTCVRARYREGYTYLFEQRQNKLVSGFHVDLPIYYSDSRRCPDLAHLKDSWTVSDPIEFIKWFEQKVNARFNVELLYERRQFSAQYEQWKEDVRKEDAQLRRIVRYLKAWCDYQNNDMPCGIILTILVANSYKANSRDDVSLRDTLEDMHSKLSAEFVCRRPTTPVGEDLLADYEGRSDFMQKLKAFVDAARQAVSESNQKRACGKWQLQFGNRFSCALALDYDENALTFGSPAIVTNNAKSA